MTDSTKLGRDEQRANDAYDAHLDAGEAMDALLHVAGSDREEYKAELVDDAIENFEAAINHLEKLQTDNGEQSDGGTP